VAAIACLSSPASHADELYKCKGPGEFDSVVWQDVPCNVGEEVNHRKLHNYAKEDASKKGHGDFTSKDVSQLIRFRKIAVGMSKKDVIKSWGFPSDTNTTLATTGKTEQLVYGLFPDNSYVYINEKGVVSSIQYSEEKKKPTKGMTGLGNVNTGSFGQYNKL